MRWEDDCEWQVKVRRKAVLLRHSPGKLEELARELGMAEDCFRVDNRTDTFRTPAKFAALLPGC